MTRESNSIYSGTRGGPERAVRLLAVHRHAVGLGNRRAVTHRARVESDGNNPDSAAEFNGNAV
ncbi:MAG TPA: hypothetical protein VIO57_02065, partial [Chloroflexota bacterium]